MVVIFHTLSNTLEVRGRRGITVLSCTDEQFSAIVHKNRRRIAHVTIDYLS